MVDYQMFTGKPDGSEIDTDRHGIIKSWLDYAATRDNAFERFVFRWMSFNGWLACVTGEDRDSKMLSDFAADQTSVAMFDNLMTTSKDFKTAVVAFAKLWPIFNAADVFKLGKSRPRAITLVQRPAYVSQLLQKKKVRHRPRGWKPGTTTPPRLEDLFDGVYQVRCNLFHGDKVTYADIDRELIEHADLCLRLWIEKSDCYKWH